MENKFIGFDTSNYTTSVGILTGAMLYINQKKLLPVKSGEKGLRQSDAVFLHIKALPELILQAGIENPTAVGVSTRPRSVEGSYMPCFTVGELAAKAVSEAAGVDCYEFSHQQGHIAAALLSSNKEELLFSPFYAYHLSGGTMEMLYVKNIDEIEIVSKTLDITAGQLIDRVGVMLGLPFPCGAGLEKLASAGSCNKKINVVQKNGDVCVSGYENIAKKMFESGESAENIAAFVMAAVLKNIKATVLSVFEKNGALPCVFAGGVMSNEYLKTNLSSVCEAYFAQPALSADNAVGTAYLTKLKYEGKI